MKTKPVSFIPYVCGAGGSTPGCEGGPSDLLRHGLGAGGAGWPDGAWREDPEALYDAPGETAHKSPPPRGSPARRDLVLRQCRHIRDSVEDAAKRGALPVTIGGDHSMAAGSVAGLARARGRTGLIWIDAHPDINTPQTTPSGAWHGMPVAALLGLGDQDFAGLAGGGAAVRPEHLFYFGLRDIDPGERALLSSLPVRSFTVEDVRREGAAAILRRIADELSGAVDCLALSLDIDAFDPALAPATGTPVPGGFAADDLLPALADFVRERPFDLVEIAEYNPALPGADRTRDFIRRALAALLPRPEGP